MPTEVIGLTWRPIVFSSWSTPLPSRDGGFLEIFRPCAFDAALGSRTIIATLNHDDGRLLGRKGDGTLTLRRDARGIAATVLFPRGVHGWLSAAVDRIRRGERIGGSFRFIPVECWSQESARHGAPVKVIERALLTEVSLITPPREPAYPGTLGTVELITI